jgi:hypothetical protein
VGVLLRRELLCIFQHAYRWAALAGEHRRRLWPCILDELRMAADMVVMAFVDTRRPVDCRVLATDSSGAGGGDLGGFGVCERTWSSEQVWHCVSRAEKWRYAAEATIAARAHALGLEDTRTSLYKKPHRQTHAGGSDFDLVPLDWIEPFDDWKILFRGRWNREENIIRTEGRGLVLAVRHRLREGAGAGHRMLLLCDNLGLVLGIGKRVAVQRIT